MPTAAHLLTREQELHWLALKMTPGLGTRSAGQLIRKLRTPEAIFRASASELEGHGLSRSIAQSIASGCAFEDAADQQNKLAEFGTSIVPISDPRYPARLREIYDPPVVLFAKGKDRVARHADVGGGRDAPAEPVRSCCDGKAFGGSGDSAAYNREWNGARHRHRGPQCGARRRRKYHCGFWLRRRLGVSCGEPQAGSQPSPRRDWCFPSFRWGRRRIRRISRFAIEL